MRRCSLIRCRLPGEPSTDGSARAAWRFQPRPLAGAATTAPGTRAGSSVRQQRPWDSWSLPALPASQQQARRTAKLSGGATHARAMPWPCSALPAGRHRCRRCSSIQARCLPLVCLECALRLGPQRGVHRPSAPSFAGLLWEVGADLAWLGVSLVGAAQEVAYLRGSGLRASLKGTAAHLMLDLELRELQVGGLSASPACTSHRRPAHNPTSPLPPIPRLRPVSAGC